MYIYIDMSNSGSRLITNTIYDDLFADSLNIDNNNKVYVDKLTVDKPIEGQNYACIWFLFPRNFKKITDALKALVNGTQSKEQADLLNSNPVNKKSENSDDEYEPEAPYISYGIKIRGIFATLQQANDYADFLHKFDDGAFDVLVAPVGYWTPVVDNPLHVTEDVKYEDEKLNNIMVNKLKKQQKLKQKFKEQQSQKKNNNMKISSEIITENELPDNLKEDPDLLKRIHDKIDELENKLF